MLFIDNKYTSTYYSIITRAMNRVNPQNCYTEKHHIIPKSLGGSNKKNNIVELTAREHFICHRLLVRMTQNDANIKMQRALWALCVHTTKRLEERQRITGKLFEQIRKEYIESITGIPKTSAHKAKLGKYKRTKEHRKRISEWRKAQIGLQRRTDETKERMSVWQKGVPKPKVTCEHCSKQISLMNYNRWHGNNCKYS